MVVNYHVSLSKRAMVDLVSFPDPQYDKRIVLRVWERDYGRLSCGTLHCRARGELAHEISPVPVEESQSSACFVLDS